LHSDVQPVYIIYVNKISITHVNMLILIKVCLLDCFYAFVFGVVAHYTVLSFLLYEENWKPVW